MSDVLGGFSGGTFFIVPVKLQLPLLLLAIVDKLICDNDMLLSSLLSILACKRCNCAYVSLDNKSNLSKFDKFGNGNCDE